MRIEPSFSGASIVCLGSFNPPILTPDWLLAQDLIGPQEAKALEIEVIHKQISSLIGDAFKINVTLDRFTIVTEKPPFDVIFDLIRRIFTEKLPHTPVRAMGINRTVHFKLADSILFNTIGEKLAPKDPWGQWGLELARPDAQLDADKTEKIRLMSGRAGGLRSITMEQSVRFDEYAGYIRAKVEPSTVVELGVLVEVNDHFEFPEDKRASAEAAVEALTKKWKDSISHSEWIIDQIMAL